MNIYEWIVATAFVIAFFIWLLRSAQDVPEPTEDRNED